MRVALVSVMTDLSFQSLSSNPSQANLVQAVRFVQLAKQAESKK